MQTVLLIEDDPFLIDIYTTKLKGAGLKVETAISGDQGLRKIKELKPALVLLDIVLPSSSGWEVLKKIKSIKGAEDIKIIILSNLGQKQEVEKGLKLGAVRYLIKAHYTPSQIVEEVKAILKD